MSVTVYRYSDTSAPTLQGIVGGALTGGAFADGSLVELLRKCLVAGYGSKSGSGWTMPYTASSKAVFKQGGGSSFYLDVDDSGAATAKEARVRGYEVMTAVATGTYPFPTVAQVAVAAANWRKSATADTTQRPWHLIADDRTFHLFIAHGDTTGYSYYHFGDIYSVLTGDAYKCEIVVRTAENGVVTSTTDRGDAIGWGSSAYAAITGQYIARSYLGIGGSVNYGRAAAGGVYYNAGANPHGMSSTSVHNIPNPVDGTIMLAKPWIYAATTHRRGYHRGVWHLVQSGASFTDLDTISGLAAGSLTGRTFQIFKGMPFSANAAVCIDITGPWDTSA